MTKVSKESGCKGMTEWIKPCGKHFYWSVCSLHDGNGIVMWQLLAKFRSDQSLEDLLFSKCADGPDISPCEYLFEGMFQSVY